MIRNDTQHELGIEYESRAAPTDGPWIEREPTGGAQAHCSCGFTVEGPDGEALPCEEVERRADERRAELEARQSTELLDGDPE